MKIKMFSYSKAMRPPIRNDEKKKEKRKKKKQTKKKKKQYKQINSRKHNTPLMPSCRILAFNKFFKTVLIWLKSKILRRS